MHTHYFSSWTQVYEVILAFIRWHTVINIVVLDIYISILTAAMEKVVKIPLNGTTALPMKRFANVCEPQQ